MLVCRRLVLIHCRFMSVLISNLCTEFKKTRSYSEIRRVFENKLWIIFVISP